MGGSIDQMRASFEAQFEATTDSRYVYRRSLKGEGIPVTAQERERFVTEYIKRIRLIMAGMVAAVLAFFGAVVWVTMKSNGELPDVLLYVGIAVIAVVAICLMYWALGAPARELRGRTPVEGERSRDEIREITFSKLSYGQLAGVAAMGALLPFTLRSHPDLLHGWGRLWLLLSAGLVLLAAVQAFRKWRFESNKSEPN